MQSWLARQIISRVMARTRVGDIGPTLALDADDVHFVFPGENSWSGEYHGKDAHRRWLERLVRVGVKTESDEVVASGWPWNTTVCIRGRSYAHNPKGEGGPTFKDLTQCPFDYHTLSHHSEDPEKLRLWTAVDRVYMAEWAYFLGKLKGVREGQGTLLDHTMAAWGTVQGEAGHSLTDLPFMLAGGAGLGIKHQGHLAFDRENNTLLSNLFVRMMHQTGIEAKSFGASNGVVSEV